MRHLMHTAFSVALLGSTETSAAGGGATPAGGGSKLITIQGHQFAVPTPYDEGHTLTAVEAGVLNQTFAENIRNNTSKMVAAALEEAKKAGTAPDLDAIKAKVDAYIADYEFGAVRVGGPQLDPVTREALKLAKQAVREKLKAKNIDIKSLAEGELDKLAQELVDTKPAYKDVAKRRLDEAAALAAEVASEG